MACREPRHGRGAERKNACPLLRNALIFKGVNTLSNKGKR
ncbi:hypothetical protein DESPIG_02411 [Desulfovibrio piger ATCC 29098]|uniref:Uncharacterized protein n=1 Tax=Desulfovibrio piger ATCC 29098 TaxID=411464 RepID=B6WWE3_9BACT|nr:hypothetical protein DESPIG_02411 [Desulfovibrio piger ATCC 29098]